MPYKCQTSHISKDVSEVSTTEATMSTTATQAIQYVYFICNVIFVHVLCPPGDQRWFRIWGLGLIINITDTLDYSVENQQKKQWHCIKPTHMFTPISFVGIETGALGLSGLV